MRRSPMAVGAFAIALVAAAAEPAPRFLEVPAGVTPLADIGLYRIGYRRIGKEPVWMPPSWTGGMSEESGLAFQPVRHGDRPALFLHCPWRNGTGASFVEYRLRLPAGPAARFLAGIAMKPDSVGKSDGVTFVLAVGDGARRVELFRGHHAKGEVRELEIDLAPHAGKDIVLSLQVEPGPKNDPSFDFSHFVEPRIVVGPGGDDRRAQVEALTSTRAYRALQQADLSKLNNRTDRGIVPSCRLPHRNSVREDGRAFEFRYEGADTVLVYRYEPVTGTLDDVTARLDDGAVFQPCSGGGVTLVGDSLATKGTPVSVRRDGEAVEAVFRYAAGAQQAKVTWRFGIEGKALTVEARADEPVVQRFWLGNVVADFRKTILIPYLFHEQASYLSAQQAFCMGYIDWTRSHASRSPGRESAYVARTDGARNSLVEAGYVAVSPDLCEVLPNVPHEPSPYLKLLGPKVMLDIWSGRYAQIAKWLEEYRSYGCDEIATIVHNWQRYGYDVKLPDHLPANPDLGGDEEMKVLGATARRLGYLFSLHENYIDAYPDAPSYDEKDIVRTPVGELSKAWYHPGTKVQSFAIKADRMLRYAARNSPEIHRRFDTTASYLDVHTCVEPWHHVDYEAGQDRAGMYRLKVDKHRELFQYMRDTHRGPLFGEGGRHFFWAGQMDGVEAQVEGGEDHFFWAEFDLLKLHPQLVNHGMGYYSRWLEERKARQFGVDWPLPAQVDRYRAQELAYGHAGFVGSELLRVWPHALREYHLVQPVQALYGAAKVLEIGYEVGGQFVSGSVAAVVGDTNRLRVKYDSGLTLHVNLGGSDWTVRGYTLPAYGFLAEGPDLLAYTARRDGTIVDYARTKETLYADARTDLFKPWAAGRKEIEPRLKEFKDLGGGKVQVAFDWRIDDTLSEDYQCFVHYCGQDGEIAMQGDHPTPTPTSAWKKGTVLVDGPHTVAVPADKAETQYDIRVGLYKGERVRLAGLPTGDRCVLVGRLSVTREGGRVKKVELADLEPLRQQIAAQQKGFLDRMNVAGRAVDFGTVKTDGVFRLAVKGQELQIWPIARDREFTVDLDVAKVFDGRRAGSATAVAFDADGRTLGAAPVEVREGRLVLKTAVSGAARYAVKAE